MEKSSKQEKPIADPKNLYIVGTQTGKCPICKKTKKLLLLLRFGLTLCDECLLVCMNILEHLQYGVVENDAKETLKNIAQRRETSKKIHRGKTNRTTQLRIPKTIKKREA